jgi:hypothetical protein
MDLNIPPDMGREPGWFHWPQELSVCQLRCRRPPRRWTLRIDRVPELNGTNPQHHLADVLARIVDIQHTVSPGCAVNTG